MSLIGKVYTAQDMRDAAKCLFACEVDLKHDNRDISKMLRQAADMMDRADGEAAEKHQFREVAKMIPHEEVDVSKMETTTQTREKSSAVGNAAAMREALMEASIALSSATHHHLTEDDAKDCLAVVEAALAAPPRNCDIGTAEEQEERHNRWCKSMKQRTECCWVVGCRKCLVAWSQMQYEEEKK